MLREKMSVADDYSSGDVARMPLGYNTCYSGNVDTLTRSG